MSSQNTQNPNTQKFMNDVKIAIQAGLTATLEFDVDESGNQDMSAYDTLKDIILQGVMESYNNSMILLEKKYKAIPAAASSAMATPKILKKARKSSGDSETRVNPYARWVSFVSHIRSGKTSGAEEVTVGEHFAKLDSPSAKKYHAIKDELGIEGKTMTLTELLEAISVIPDAKDMTLNGISWGLVSPDRRTELALNFKS